MKKCPVCNVGLVAAEYEGFRLMQCGECGGHLVPLQRLELIKRIGATSQEDLKTEATRDYDGSSVAAGVGPM